MTGKPDIYRIRLNALVSFDVVWDNNERAFIYVFVERGGIKKRLDIKIPMDQVAGLLRWQLDRMNKATRRPSRISDIGKTPEAFATEVTEVNKTVPSQPAPENLPQGLPPDDDEDDIG